MPTQRLSPRSLRQCNISRASIPRGHFSGVICLPGVFSIFEQWKLLISLKYFLCGNISYRKQSSSFFGVDLHVVAGLNVCFKKGCFIYFSKKFISKFIHKNIALHFILRIFVSRIDLSSVNSIIVKDQNRSDTSVVVILFLSCCLKNTNTCLKLPDIKDLKQLFFSSLWVFFLGNFPLRSTRGMRHNMKTEWT